MPCVIKVFREDFRVEFGDDVGTGDGERREVAV
jgi:hypothetical protein